MTEQSEMYLASRGSDFEGLIVSLLKRGGLKQKYIDVLTSGESLKAYATAFTAASANPVDNYERFEQIGDVTANKFIVLVCISEIPTARLYGRCQDRRATSDQLRGKRDLCPLG